MEKKIFYNVDEVAEMLSISRSHGYKIIREFENHELQEKGYRTITGKVSCKYFDEKFYRFADSLRKESEVNGCLQG